MKITSKILSIPPYISASWETIASVHMDGTILIVTLYNGSHMEVPGLDGESLNQIFQAHSNYLEEDTSEPESPEFNFSLPMEGLENMQSMMQHNPDQADSPPIPSEVLDKISAVTKALGVDVDQQNMPHAEPHCNCIHCQISRAMAGTTPHVGIEQHDESVTDADLTFKEWDIDQMDKQRYNVSNPLDSNEHYQVFLGEPIGCTCGRKDCEHIQAVLKS